MVLLFALIFFGLPVAAIIVLTRVFYRLLSRGSPERPGLAPWPAGVLAGSGALVLVLGGGYALLVAICSGSHL